MPRFQPQVRPHARYICAGREDPARDRPTDRLHTDLVSTVPLRQTAVYRRAAYGSHATVGISPRSLTFKRSARGQRSDGSGSREPCGLVEITAVEENYLEVVT